MNALLALFLLLGSSGSSLLVLQPQRTSWRSGETVTALLHVGGAIEVSGCGPVIEVYDPELQHWTPLPHRPCEGSPAVPAQEGQAVGVDFQVDRFSVGRVVLTYGLGCRPGLPLELAGCRELHAAISPNLALFPAEGD